MDARVSRFSSAVLVGLFAAACSSTTTPTPSVTIPRPVQPANGALTRNVDQPVTLVIQNAVVTASSGTTYMFEVATDSAFASKVQTKDAIAEGGGGRTSVRLDTLRAGTDYYWHVRAQNGGTTGVFGATYKFTVGPAVVLNAPTPVGPLTGGTSYGWPTFTVDNAPRTGPAGSIVYRFEVAASAAFTPVLVTATVAETPNQTSFTPRAEQAPAAQTTLYWRVTASDAGNGVASPASEVQSFTYAPPTPQNILASLQGFVLWPAAQPPGTNGHAVLGRNWQIQTVTSFDGVTHVIPTLEQLRVFDLLDRGYAPQAALNWMNANGYPTTAVYYSGVEVIGFPFEYMALIDGQWHLVIRVGA